jgi:hypothetical protein
LAKAPISSDDFGKLFERVTVLAKYDNRKKEQSCKSIHFPHGEEKYKNP